MVFKRYIETVFQGIISDINLTKILIATKGQLKALQDEIPEIELDITHTNEATICFKSKILLSLINTIQVSALVGMANFYIIDIPNSFFLYLKKTDIVAVKL